MRTYLNINDGSIGNSKFRHYMRNIAEGITLTGQVLLKRIDRNTNKFLNEFLKNDTPKNYVIAQDTDSVPGDTMVYANGVEVQIKDLYDKFVSYVYEDDFNKSYVKPVDDNITTKSLNTKTQQVEDKSIKYIMKHRVKKKMYRISVDDTYVDVTEDHSVIIYRNHRYMAVKPTEINNDTDYIVKI